MSQQMEAEEKKNPTPTVIKYAAGGTLLATLPFDVLAHFGPTGLLVGGMLSYVVYRHGHEAYDMARDTFPFLPALSSGRDPGDEKVTNLPAPTGTPGKRSLTDRMFGIHPEQTDQGSANADGQETAQQKDATGFVTVDRSSEVPGVPRYTVEEIASHIVRNSYQIYIGRSLKIPGNPAISISFYRRHLKVIGASQKGKSSMAGALLKIILKTHDPEHVLVALLDIENRTSKLFENDPHIARVRFSDGKETVLHARSKEQVIEHLELLVEILEYRATLTVAQVRALPLIVIYLEEFLLLKKELKQRAARLTGEAKERAEADYERFVFCVNQLAGRGLKYNLQLLVCAQVDYRDDDLYEAFANITAGFCFCVRATAAASAGFMQAELLNQNAKNNKVGQCVVETPDGHDLILAPQYDLEAELTALEKTVPAFPHSPETSQFERRDAAGNIPVGNARNVGEPLYKLGNATGNAGESSRAKGNVPTETENDSPDYTQSEETQVLLAYAELLQQGKPVTRSAIRDHLDWSSRQFSRVVKPVCDKHHIAE
jgi:FtsK/SpoIIIE family